MVKREEVYMKRILLVFSLCLFVCPSNAKDKQNSDVQNIGKIVEDYFTVYAERKDYEALMSFYSDVMVLEDMIFGFHAPNKEVFRDFFDWNKGGFSVIGNKPALVITDQVIDENSVVTRGYFNAFIYEEVEYGPWRFVTWLDFDEHGKIIKHTDWINYTPREKFLGGENLNERVVEVNK